MSATADGWVPDILGPDYAAQPLDVPRPDGTPRQATLVRHRPVVPAGTAARTATRTPRPSVLYIHGWSDYFYNTGLAEFFTTRGYDFYALDLHNHGRSLVSHDLGGYVDDLADYDDEITLAHSTIRSAAGVAGGAFPLLLMGHSTGGLVAALWAQKFPANVGQLVLNSPWLEIQGGAAIRRAATPLVRPVADLRPLTRMRVPERTFYWRGISDEAYGDWPVDRTLRPPQAFPVRAGWMRAILAAQRRVAAGLGLPMPVLVMLSSRSMLGPVWNGAMLRADVVLDVRALALRAVSLGTSVSVERVDGALHEVFLSGGEVRRDAYHRLDRWLRGYGPPGHA
ncbi:alpha/beta hydrolase [Arthrobacter sp. STN4]|uniref:alpha/beta hydrolase n=1 Tax=Arthrobacter sp. STN4 TaxID=2923276 RepID=UPI00211A7535|nr:alpha/beta hydrolase [Arthrobacter sp. STN4]MCQ9164424.1 alpha/beta hydrolase [Arthrobacter sp. STN4]